MMEAPLPALTVKSVRNKCVEQESNLLQFIRAFKLLNLKALFGSKSRGYFSEMLKTALQQPINMEHDRLQKQSTVVLQKPAIDIEIFLPYNIGFWGKYLFKIVN
jgi:hypothetical protein